MSNDLEQRLQALEARFDELDNRTDALDTQIDATEQALAAIRMAQSNEQRIKRLAESLRGISQQFKAFLFAFCGWFVAKYGTDLQVDAALANDRLGEIIFYAGVGVTVYSVAVAFGKEDKITELALSLLPGRKSP